jgi:hypothetical protein
VFFFRQKKLSNFRSLLLLFQKNIKTWLLTETCKKSYERICEKKCFQGSRKGVDFVFLAKKSIVDKSTDEIMKEVQDFLIYFKL